jgi:hypothetical protein
VTDQLPLIDPLTSDRDRMGRFIPRAKARQRAMTAKLRAEVYGGKVAVKHYVRAKHRDEQQAFV